MYKLLYTPLGSIYPFLNNPALTQLAKAVALSIDLIRISLIFKYNPVTLVLSAGFWLYVNLLNISNDSMKISVTDTRTTPLIITTMTIALQNGRAVSVVYSGSTDILCDLPNTYCQYYDLPAIQGDLSNLVVDPSCVLYTYYGPVIKLKSSYPKASAIMLSDALLSLSTTISSGYIKFGMFGYNTAATVQNDLVNITGRYGAGLGSVPDLRAYTAVLSEFDSKYHLHDSLQYSLSYISNQVKNNKYYKPDTEILNILAGLRNINGIIGDVTVVGDASVTVSPSILNNEVILTIDVPLRPE